MSNAYAIIPLLRQYNIEDTFKKIQYEIINMEYEEYCKCFDEIGDSKCHYCIKWIVHYNSVFNEECCYFEIFGEPKLIRRLNIYKSATCCESCIPKLIKDYKENTSKFRHHNIIIDIIGNDWK